MGTLGLSHAVQRCPVPPGCWSTFLEGHLLRNFLIKLCDDSKA